MSGFNGYILALDLASVTGWAYGKPNKPPKFGNIRLMKPGGQRAAAYRKFRLWLDLFFSVNDVALVVFESPLAAFMHGTTNMDTLKMLTGLAEHLEEWCHARVELREANVSQIRHHFIGDNPKSKIAKERTVQQCRDYGWNVQTTDEADACALWHYQCCCLLPELGTASTPLFGARHG